MTGAASVGAVTPGTRLPETTVHLTRADLDVAGDERSITVVDRHLPVVGDRFDLPADQLVRDRVAGRCQPDRRQLVDLA